MPHLAGFDWGCGPGALSCEMRYSIGETEFELASGITQSAMPHAIGNMRLVK
jgi:hypothetical protein